MNRILVACCLALVVLLINSDQGAAVLTEAQLEESKLLMRQACQPKTKATDAEVEGLRDKIFPDSKTAKCFVNCVLEMMQVIKKGKVQADVAIRSMRNMLPEEMANDNINAVNACLKAAVGIKDNCEAAYALLKCQAANTVNFVFV